MVHRRNPVLHFADHTAFCQKNNLETYFEYNKPFLKQTKKQIWKRTNYAETNLITSPNPVRSNRILIKGAITAALIGIMMIPTVYISDLVQERQARNEAVVKEVDSRWAMAQTISGPYIYLPYKSRQ